MSSQEHIGTPHLGFCGTASCYPAQATILGDFGRRIQQGHSVVRRHRSWDSMHETGPDLMLCRGSTGTRKSTKFCRIRPMQQLGVSTRGGTATTTCLRGNQNAFPRGPSHRALATREPDLGGNDCSDLGSGIQRAS